MYRFENKIDKTALTTVCDQIRSFLNDYIDVDFTYLNYDEQELLETLQSAWEEGRNLLEDYRRHTINVHDHSITEQ